MKENNKIAGSVKAIAFDADDTLWALQNYFEDVEDEYCDLLSDYGSKEEISASLFETESGNMEDLGYGVKAFTISLVENAVKVSQGEVPAKLIGRIVELGKTLLRLDARPLRAWRRRWQGSDRRVIISLRYSPRVSCKTRRTNCGVRDCNVTLTW